MLESLLYVSAATPRIRQRDLENILHSSACNNQRAGITGALIFSGSTFAQVLEGTKSALDELMTTLEADARHSALTIVAREKVESRRFPSWSMAYRHIEGLMVERLHGQLGWDATIQKLLDDIPSDRSLKALSSSIAGIVEQNQPQWASSQF